MEDCTSLPSRVHLKEFLMWAAERVPGLSNSRTSIRQHTLLALISVLSSQTSMQHLAFLIQLNHTIFKHLLTH